MKKNILWLAALGVLTVQAEEADSLRVMSLQEVQVVSTRASQKTPMAFTNMGKEAIKAVNYGHDVPYLLSLTPSVTMTSDAGNGIGYTSLRVRGTAPERINITANGIPMNDAESAQLYWVNMGDFASSVQSMQIQRGVGTSTNGAGAFGATVNMLTESVGTKPFVGIDLSAGSYYSHKETVRFGTGMIGEHWGIQGRLSNIGSKGYIDRASTKLNSYLLQGGYFGDNTVVKFITWNGEEQTYHAWDYTSKYEQQLYGRTFNPCGAMTWDNDRFYDNQTDNYHQQNYQLIWNQRLSHEYNFNAALHYTRGDGYYEQFKIDAKWADYGMFTAAPADVQTDAGGLVYKPIVKGDLIRQKKMANDFYGAVFSLIFNNHKGQESVLGGGWNKYDGDHFGRVIWASGAPYLYYYNKDNDKKLKNAAGKTVYGTVYGTTVTPDWEYYRNNAQKTDFNIYTRSTSTLSPGLNAYVDLQYRRIRYKMQNPGDWWGANTDNAYVVDDTYNFFNPKFGLNYDITPNHKVYASYAIAHKEPTRNDYESNLGLDLKSERLNDLELGYKFQSPTFSAGVNLYWMNYKNQFVLTGELNEIGEAVAINVPKSYRLGAELEAAWQPVDWFRWDANATFSKNRVKNAVVTLDDGTNASVGDTPLSFSPGVIFNNILTFSYRGLKAAVQSQYIGEQYLTNSGFKTMTGWDANGNETTESLLLDSHFTTNVDISYTFCLKQFGIKDVTAGVTLYNIFSAKYDTNGWAAPAYQQTGGQVRAYNASYASDGALCDQWAVGFAPSAPFNMMAHLSVNF
ncbi:MAG: TonB-dependent receptor [Prevotella sp.]|nr:TonB-dependent receptor [Prevotella sp.]